MIDEQAGGHGRGFQHRISLRPLWLAYLGTSLSIGVFSAFNNFTLTLWLSGLTSSYLLLGLMGNTKSFEGALVSPIVGTWSDRLWMPWLGRRRPFILVGGLLSALLLALTPTLSRWPLPDTLAQMLPDTAPALVMAVAVIFLFTVTFNSMDDLHKALLADVTTPEERNTLSGLNVVVDMAGQVGILLLGFLLWTQAVPEEAFVITGILMSAGVLLTVWGVKEPPPAVWNAERVSLSESGPRLTLGVALRRYRGAVVLVALALLPTVKPSPFVRDGA